MKDNKTYIKMEVPVERKQYYNADVIKSLMNQISKEGLVFWNKGEENHMRPLDNLEDLEDFYKIMKLTLSKKSKVDEELVGKFEKGLEDLKKGKFKRVR